MTKNKLTKKEQRTIKKDIKNDIDKNINKSIKQRVDKVSLAMSDTVYSVTERRMSSIESSFRKNRKIILISAAAASLFVLLVLFVSARKIESQVKKEMAVYYETQTELLENYKLSLENRLDSISQEHKEALYAKIDAEANSKSFKNYVTSVTKKEFDKVAPDMIEPLAKRYLEDIVLKIENKAGKTLDSLEREIIKKQSEVATDKSTAMVESE